MLISLLLTLPVVLLDHGRTPMRWELLQLAGFGPPLVALSSQLILRKDWYKRLLYYPLWILVGIGLALTNLAAIWDAFMGTTNVFERTPKAPPGNQQVQILWPAAGLDDLGRNLPGLLCVCDRHAGLGAGPRPGARHFPYALGFGYTAALGFMQADALGQSKTARQTQTN